MQGVHMNVDDVKKTFIIIILRCKELETQQTWWGTAFEASLMIKQLAPVSVHADCGSTGMLTVVLLACACGTRGICESLLASRTSGTNLFWESWAGATDSTAFYPTGEGVLHDNKVEILGGMPCGMRGVVLLDILAHHQICSSVICTKAQLTKVRWSPFWLILECLAETHVC